MTLAKLDIAPTERRAHPEAVRVRTESVLIGEAPWLLSVQWVRSPPDPQRLGPSLLNAHFCRAVMVRTAGSSRELQHRARNGEGVQTVGPPQIGVSPM